MDRTTEALDTLYGEVNALGGAAPAGDAEATGYARAISDVLDLIEAAGGLDPLVRAHRRRPRHMKELATMTVAQTIANARRFLQDGNHGAYARSMSAAIRSARSDRTASALHAAIAEDRTEHLFRGLDTASPIAA